MKTWFQIYTGNVHQLSVQDADVLLKRIGPFYEAGKLSGVLSGWGWDPAFYEKVGQQLKAWHVPFFFKTAAFSEIEEAPSFLQSSLSFDPMIGSDGQEVPRFVLNEQEQFLFRCPSSKTNRELALSYLDTFLSRFSFDGVFFDRIRYSSLISGIHGMGCFCPRCQRIYEKAGINVTHLRSALTEAEDTHSLGLTGYQEGRWILRDPDMTKFFQVRCQILGEAVSFFTKTLKERGYQVGLDLFAPCFGYFAGQDVIALSQQVDFIKPMMYRFTDAPAGLIFEQRALKAVDPFPTGTVKELFTSELEMLKKNAASRVYPGIDMNVIDPICHPSKEEIRETLDLLKKLGYSEIVASWNLMKIPEEYLELLLTC